MVLSRQQSNEGNIIDADEVLERIMKKIRTVKEPAHLNRFFLHEGLYNIESLFFLI